MQVSTQSDAFDYIIIGAGSAGAIVAARLSERRQASVCVLEAGPTDRHPYLHVPGGFIKVLANPKLTWQFATEPSERTANRPIAFAQGRTLGGSSAVNGLIYNRGQPMDYDVWAQRGNAGWSYRDVLPYFKLSEGRIGPGDDAVRGRDGPLKVTDIDWNHPLCDAFVDGVEALGIPRNQDYNSGRQAGVGYYQRTIFRTRRVSSARSFLHPAMRSGRIDVRTGAQVTCIRLEKGRAVGVDYVHGRSPGVVHRLHAACEVILCAGAINSPKLLQISGIGPSDALTAADIPIRHELPGVGRNLQDHYAVRMVARVRNIDTINDRVKFPRLAWEGLNWLLGRPSVLGLSPSLAHVFWMSAEGLEQPDLQFTFTPASYSKGRPGLLDSFPGMTCGVWQHRPESVGWTRVRSADPFAAPAIQPNYLAAEADRRALLAGIRLARTFLGTAALSPWFDGEAAPGSAAVTDRDLLDWAYREGSTAYHLVGTCRMGPATDPDAVVDADLRVHGLRGLRVVDASVMPTVTSGNTNAPTMMIAEKASAMILDDGGDAARADRS
ncbi:MAG: choline dehydrogenase [Rhizobiales bacterium]|nr:choline dehydrogenase [Hyphomicrobiales bacterium]